ncbi:MAG: diguanylate cyclase [Calditrichaeota bacterium]|nr:MAG: diguanylate cyclase [Calditrichota bacterium]
MENFLQNDYSLEQLKRLAFFDELTGVYNRRYFKERFAEESQRAKRYSRSLSIMMIDIDLFKAINDTFGHLVGDEIIKKVAEVLKEAVRDTDIVFRYAGDEFIVLLPESSKEGAMGVGERMVTLAKESKLHSNGKTVTFGLSVGVANYLEDTNNIDEILHLADVALYNAKSAGRGRVSGKVIKNNAETDPTKSNVIGREKELKTITKIFEQVTKSNGQTVILKSEVGMGRTTFLFDFKESLKNRYDFTVMRGQSYKENIPVSYQPIREALNKFVEAYESLFFEVVEKLSIEQRAEIARLLPNLRNELLKSESVDISNSDEYKLYNSVYNLIKGLSEINNVIFVIEDIQWVDDTTLNLISYLVRNLNDKRVLICITGTNSDKINDFTIGLSKRNTHVSFINLLPLTKENTKKYLIRTFENQTIEPKLIERFYALTSGVPVFVKELASYFLTHPDKDLNSLISLDDVPLTIKEIVFNQLSTLEKDLVNILEIMAIIGKETSFEMISEVSEIEENYLFDHLESLIKLDLIVENVRGKEEYFSFKNLMIRDVIYQRSVRLKRKKYHFKIANVIEKLNYRSLEKYYEELVIHYYSAKVWDRTCEYALKAAKKSREIYSNEISLKFLEIAKETIEIRIEDEPNYSTLLIKLFDVVSEHEKVLNILGNLNAQKNDLDQMMEIAKKLDDRAKISDVYLKLSNYYLNKGELDKPGILASMGLKTKQELGDKKGEAIALRILGNICYRQRLEPSALKYYELSLQIAKELNDEKLISAAIGNIGNIHIENNDFEKSQKCYIDSYELNKKLNDKVGMIIVLQNLSMLELDLGNLEKALSLSNESLKLSRELGKLKAESDTLSLLAQIYLAIGDFANSLSYLEKALTISKEIGNFVNEFSQNLIFVSIFIAQEKYFEAEKILENFDGFAISNESQILIFNLKLSWIELFFEQKKYEQSLDIVQVLLQDRKFTINNSQQTILYYYLAKLHYFLEKKEEAKEASKKLLEKLSKTIRFNNIDELFFIHKLYQNSNDENERELALKYLAISNKIVNETAEKIYSKELKKLFFKKKINSDILREFEKKSKS